MSKPIERAGKIFSADLIAKALRDSGYKNTAFALAELIDNSIQAAATDVEVFCFEQYQDGGERQTRRLQQIAVLDNGGGMDAEVLRAALMFGNGTRLNDRSGIGRFGMGLPNASFSQAKRVEVWSWIDGPANAMRTYLDLDEITKEELVEVPIPEHCPLPTEWYDRAQHEIGDSGTLVLWSELDQARLTWKRAGATLKHTEELAGRIYRYFIHDGKIRLRLAAVENGDFNYDKVAVATDPLYLLTPSSTPKPFDNTPMFQTWGSGEDHFDVDLDGEVYRITIRLSYAKPETVPEDGRDRGSLPYGWHAGKNIGVSLLRAGRELELDSNWAIGYEPRERWWGCEVEFPPALDEMFGVTINKQAATLWSQFAQLKWDALAEEGENTRSQVIDRLKREGDSRGVLLDLAEHIRQQLKGIREAIKDQTKFSRSKNKRHDGPTVEDLASSKIRDRAEEHPTPQDEQEFGDDEAAGLQKDLTTQKNYPDKAAESIVKAVWERKLRIIYVTAELDGHAFFKVEDKPGGVAEVVINKKHPFYECVYDVLDPEDENDAEATVEERLAQASSMLRLLFAAWARYEQESSAKERMRLDDIRQDWGRMARYFLENEDDEE